MILLVEWHSKFMQYAMLTPAVAGLCLLRASTAVDQNL